VLSVNVQHTERNALLYRAYTNIHSGAEVSYTNRCRSVGTLRHYNLVPKCPVAEVSREPLQLDGSHC